MLDDGSQLNLDQLAVELASHPRTYVIQWVEMGNEVVADEYGEPPSLCSPETYKKGLRRWFGLFHNSSTEKLIHYMTRLLARDQTVVLPDDLMLGGFSTAFGAGVKPDKIVLRLDPNHKGFNFRHQFEVWDQRPRVVAQR